MLPFLILLLEVGLAKVKFPTSLREEQQQQLAAKKVNCCSSKESSTVKEQIVKAFRR
jgi:hypothetical protein